MNIPDNAFIRLTALSWYPLTVTFRAFVRMAGGVVTPWTKTLTVTTALTLTAVTESIPSGELLEFTATGSNTGLLNNPDTYVRAEIYYGAYALGHLVARVLGCYLRDAIAMGLPQESPGTVFDGNKGYIYIPFAAVAVGTSLSYAIGTFGLETIHHARMHVVCDATVANRYATLRVSKGISYAMYLFSSTAILATQTVDIAWNFGRDVEVVAQGIIYPVMPKMTLAPADALILTLVNIQAGDQLSGGYFAGEPWLNC